MIDILVAEHLTVVSGVRYLLSVPGEMGRIVHAELSPFILIHTIEVHVPGRVEHLLAGSSYFGKMMVIRRVELLLTDINFGV